MRRARQTRLTAQLSSSTHVRSPADDSDARRATTGTASSTRASRRRCRKRTRTRTSRSACTSGFTTCVGVSARPRSLAQDATTMSTSQFKSNVTKIDDAVFKLTRARANYFRFVRLRSEASSLPSPTARTTASVCRSSTASASSVRRSALAMPDTRQSRSTGASTRRTATRSACPSRSVRLGPRCLG